MSTELSVVIPFKDEQRRLGASLQSIQAYLRDHITSYEVILVDDGSADQTVESVIRPAQKKDQRIKLITHKSNQGKGAAVRTGVLASVGDYVLFTDADLSTPISELPKLFSQRERSDIVIGSRTDVSLLHIRQPLYRELPGKFGNYLIRSILRLPFKDTQCGFKLFSAESAHYLFGDLHLKKWGFDFEILYHAKIFGYKISEVSVVWQHDTNSRFIPLVDHAKTFFELLLVRWLYRKN